MVHITEFRCSTENCSREGWNHCYIAWHISMYIELLGTALESCDITMVKHRNPMMMMICKHQIATHLTVIYTETCLTDWHWQIYQHTAVKTLQRSFADLGIHSHWLSLSYITIFQSAIVSFHLNYLDLFALWRGSKLLCYDICFFLWGSSNIWSYQDSDSRNRLKLAI